MYGGGAKVFERPCEPGKQFSHTPIVRLSYLYQFDNNLHWFNKYINLIGNARKFTC
jgi:hypothetical protein